MNKKGESQVRLLIGGGGTGGGVYPALAVLQVLSQTSHEILWVGSQGGMEADLVQRAGIPFLSIPAAGLHGVGLQAFPGNLIRLIKGFFAARRILKEFKPDVLFFTGGYVSLPIAYAGRNLPSLVFLPDIEPGLSIKFISRFASTIGLSTQDSLKYFADKSKLIVTGYPTRSELNAWNRESARNALNLQHDKNVIMVFGGSQGAQSINRAVISILPKLLKRYQIIHISGPKNWDEVSEIKSNIAEDYANNYHAFPYLHSDQLGAAFHAADLVISRAGAAVLGEYPQFGLPAILVPYPFAWRYQQVNAEYLENFQAAIVIQDGEMKNLLLSTINNLFDQPEQLKSMSDAMKSLANPQSAVNIMRALENLGGKNRVSEVKPK